MKKPGNSIEIGKEVSSSWGLRAGAIINNLITTGILDLLKISDSIDHFMKAPDIKQAAAPNVRTGPLPDDPCVSWEDFRKKGNRK